jgi:hypothetical protein
MIDTKKPVRFYDDRNKVKEYFLLKQVLFEDEKECLCISSNGDFADMNVLFNKKTGEVLSKNITGLYAENYDTKETLLTKKAIEFVKNTYCTKDVGEFMFLGDVAQLITELTGVKVELEELRL